MENSIEEKSRFFAQHFGQKVRVWKEDLETVSVISYASLSDEAINNSHLQLKPLNQITDEDAIEVAIMFNYYQLGANRYFEEWRVSRMVNGNISVTLSNSHYDLKVVISLGGWIWSNDNNIPTNYKHDPRFFDYLRSKSYLIPFGGKSVEEILKLGWCRY